MNDDKAVKTDNSTETSEKEKATAIPQRLASESAEPSTSAVLEVPTEPTLEEAKSEKEIMAKLDEKQVEEFDQKVLDIARVTRVTKGGKRFTFRAAIVIGNKRGKVGFGIGKGNDVAQAVDKAFKRAKKHLITVEFKDNTIPHEIQVKLNSAVIYLKPASKGSGVRAGGAMRVIAKLAGIQDVSGKIISRANNKINIARATIEALKKLKNRN